MTKLRYFGLLMVMAGMSVCAVAQAQFLKRFNLGLSFGPAIGVAGPASGSTGPRLAFAFEPGFLIMKSLNVTFKIEAAGNVSVGPVNEVDSYGISTQYFFSAGSFHPVIGIGLASYRPGFANGILSNNFYSSDEKHVLGFYPVIGLKFHAATVVMNWNIAPKSALRVHDGPDTYPGKMANSYFSIKAGLLLGWFNHSAEKD